MEVKLLKVIERHQILMLALRKQISQIKAACALYKSDGFKVQTRSFWYEKVIN